MAMDSSRADLLGRSPRFHARTSGLVGLLVLASGSFAGYVASRLIVRGDVAATSVRIVEAETLFRWGIAGGLVMMVAWLFYALFLQSLLRPVNRSRARTMIALVIASAPIYLLNQVNQYAALVSASARREEQVKLFLELHRFGNVVAAIFFGLWLFPLGLLVLRSGFLPRVLGVLLVLGTPGYLVLVVQTLLFPGSEP